LKAEVLSLGKRIYKAQKIKVVIGSKAKTSLRECKNGYKIFKSGYSFVDESRQGIPLLGFYRLL